MKKNLSLIQAIWSKWMLFSQFHVRRGCNIWLPLISLGLLVTPILAQDSGGQPLSKPDIVKMLDRNTPQGRIKALILQRHTDFALTEEIENDLKKNHGASDDLISALRLAGLRPPPSPPIVVGSGTPPTRVENAAAKAAEKKRPTSSAARSIYQQRDPKIVAALTEAQKLQKSGDIDGALAKYHEAVLMDPHDSYLHESLALCLELDKHDYDAAVAEYRAGARVDDQGMAYYFHRLAGEALEKKADWQGALDEYRLSKKLNSKYGGITPVGEAKLMERIKQAPTSPLKP